MPTTFSATATVTARIQATVTRTDEIAPARDRVDLSEVLELSAGDITTLYRKTLTVPDGGPTNVPVSPDTYNDGFGEERELTSIKAILIRNKSTTAWLKVGNLDGVSEADGPFWGVGDVGGGVNVAPGGVFMLTGGQDAYSMNDDLQLQGIGDDVTVDIVAVGL